MKEIIKAKLGCNIKKLFESLNLLVFNKLFYKSYTPFCLFFSSKLKVGRRCWWFMVFSSSLFRCVSKGERSRHEKREASYFSSSIYYGGQQHYSPPRTDGSSSTSSSHQPKETDDRTNTTPSASRGNWWKGT